MFQTAKTIYIGASEAQSVGLPNFLKKELRFLIDGSFA